MVQFYFLAVCLNVIGGLILSAQYFSEKLPFLTTMRNTIIEKQANRVVFILLTAFTGIFKILSVMQGDVPVVGDLFPALSLLLIALTFTVEFFADKSSVEGTLISRFDNILVKNSQILGAGAVIIGALHFIFPGVLFL